jgi:DNA-binding HxlR family transcriptional regulator
MSTLEDKNGAFSEVQCSKNLAATEDALYVVGGKWTLRVMIALLSGHTRFNDLQRTLKGISARVLSGELKDLEMNGLVNRVVDATRKPVLVTYEPTEYSQSLNDIISALADWGIKHKKKITAHK